MLHQKYLAIDGLFTKGEHAVLGVIEILWTMTLTSPQAHPLHHFWR